MNLSHDEPLNPNMNHRQCEKDVEACHEAFPADDQSTWKRGTSFFMGRPPRLPAVPDSFGDLGMDSPVAKAKVFGFIDLIRG
jgi:hypothetical protein